MPAGVNFGGHLEECAVLGHGIVHARADGHHRVDGRHDRGFDLRQPRVLVDVVQRPEQLLLGVCVTRRPIAADAHANGAGRALLFIAATVFGHFTIIPLLSPFLVANVGLPEHDLFLVYFIGGVLTVFTAPLIGKLADHFGRFRVFAALVTVASLVILVFILLFPTQVPLFYLLGIVFGLGYGLYYAVDWALACDALPDRDRPAKDMGLFHVAYTLPQVFLPSVFGVVLDLFNRQSANSGYRVIFSGAILFYLLGTVLVSRVKSVR